MIKRTLLGAGVLLALTGLAACNDEAFLTEVPYDFVGPGNFYQNAGDALAAVAGAYATATHTTGDGYYGRNFIMLSEFMTEMQTVYLSATNERSLVDNYTFTASHAYIYTTWQGAYQGINRANSVIDRVPPIDMDQTLRSRIVAEAKFLRALHYFNLVRLFGAVPLLTQETVSIENLQRPRAPEDSVWNLIFTDLTQAAAVLPRNYTGADIGRATRGAAKTLLAKAYLHRGSINAATKAADFAKALEAIRDVKANDGYALVPNFATLFDMVNENNTEVIYDLQCSRTNGVGCRLSNQVAPRLSNYGASQNGSFNAEQPFFEEYVVADRRREATWQLSYTTKQNTIATWQVTTANPRGAFFVGTTRTDSTIAPNMNKFMDRLSVTAGNDEPNYIILRYGDNLLMEAELINEISGPTGDAYAAMNLVRARAGIPNLVTGLSQAAFRDSVFLQRRLELAMEGPNGYFDSQRNWAWSKARIEANMAYARTISFRSSRFPKAQVALTDRFKLMPIPQRARDLNPLLTQNTGW
ncbi:MAG: RagB/SusD family nutrient uptake outer membrane protein [Gemmatimonadaceae bacterium]|nr:RagB/SusD family nutrient uptake outer membrane protein [Gemmatimonadaceae bacterium]